MPGTEGLISLCTLLMQLPRAVTALAAKGDLTFAAAGGVIEECKRMHR